MVYSIAYLSVIPHILRYELVFVRGPSLKMTRGPDSDPEVDKMRGPDPDSEVLQMTNTSMNALFIIKIQLRGLFHNSLYESKLR